MSVVGVLQNDTDPMVSVMKLEKAPTESYADIELIQKYLGDGPKLVRELFRVAEEHAPSIVLLIKLMLLELN
ncbi:7076_t:CDS:2, partial [Cetraspora pellucida]